MLETMMAASIAQAQEKSAPLLTERGRRRKLLRQPGELGGIDPAIAGGVVLTTITDVAGFFIFLGMAAIVYA